MLVKIAGVAIDDGPQGTFSQQKHETVAMVVDGVTSAKLDAA